MRILRDVAAPLDHGISLAIGNFDGVHKGHRTVLDDMLNQADVQGIASGVMTFEPHPRRFFVPDLPPLMIEPFHVKARRLKALGVDYMFALRFNADLAALHADDFIQKLLVETLKVQHVSTGTNFLFGRGRSGNNDSLEEAAEERGFSYHAISPVSGNTVSRSMTISSTRIRQFLADGDMLSASGLLGRPYEMMGKVMQGDKRGHAMGFPTANIYPHRETCSPKHGVYAVRFAVDAPHDSEPQWYHGVANFGLRPTFGGDEAPRLEVHGFDFDRDIYGARLRVQFYHHMRDEKKFDNMDELIAQITQDSKEARAWLNQHL